MNRREALEFLLALPILAGCGSAYHVPKVSEAGNVLTVDATEFQDGEGGYRKSLLVRSKQYTYPIYLFRDNAGAYSAFLAECTHKGCELQLEGSVLACPCHGSEFTITGTVLNGPATKDLRSFRVSQDGRQIRIHLS